VVEKKVPSQVNRSPDQGGSLRHLRNRPKILAQGWQGSLLSENSFRGTSMPEPSWLWAKASSVFRLATAWPLSPQRLRRLFKLFEGFYTVCFNYGNVAAGHRHYGFTVNGGYAEYAVNHINTLHRIPDALNFEEATLITTAGTGMYGSHGLEGSTRARPWCGGAWTHRVDGGSTHQSHRSWKSDHHRDAGRTSLPGS